MTKRDPQQIVRPDESAETDNGVILPTAIDLESSEYLNGMRWDRAIVQWLDAGDQRPLLKIINETKLLPEIARLFIADLVEGQLDKLPGRQGKWTPWLLRKLREAVFRARKSGSSKEDAIAAVVNRYQIERAAFLKASTQKGITAETREFYDPEVDGDSYCPYLTDDALRRLLERMHAEGFTYQDWCERSGRSQTLEPE
jgi:hypothetical protein